MIILAKLQRIMEPLGLSFFFVYIFHLYVEITCILWWKTKRINSLAVLLLFVAVFLYLDGLSQRLDWIFEIYLSEVR